MAEFDDKLNALLSDPNSMAQIMQLAQSLSGAMGTGSSSTPQSTPSGCPPPMGEYQQPAQNNFSQQQGGYPPSQGNFSQQQGGYPPPQGNPQQQGGYSPPQGNPQQQSGYPPPQSNYSSVYNNYMPQGAPPINDIFQGANSLSSMLGSIDPKMIAKLMPLVGELASPQNNNSRTLLFALRPYLKAERQDKIERALQLARIVHIGKKFIAGWEA